MNGMLFCNDQCLIFVLCNIYVVGHYHKRHLYADAAPLYAQSNKAAVMTDDTTITQVGSRLGSVIGG